VYGRRCFLLGAFSMVCAGNWLLYATAHGYINIWIYLSVDACSGLVPFLPALLSVIADESTPERRAANFGFLMASFEVPLLFIPLLAGKFDLQTNALLAATAGSVGFLFAIAYGETLAPENRLAVVDSTTNVWAPHKALSILNSAPIFRRLSVVILSNTLVLAGLQTCFLFYVESAFNMDRSHATMFLGILAIGGLCSQLFILPALTRWIGLSSTLLVGLSCQFVQSLFLLISSMPFLVLSCVLGGGASMVFPCVSALKANAVGEDQQGRIQGAVSGLQSFANGAGPLVFGAIFAYLQKPGGHIPVQMAFSVSGIILLPALLSAACLYKVVGGNRARGIVPDSTSLQQPLPNDTGVC